MDGGVRGVAANGVLSDSQTNLGCNPRKAFQTPFRVVFSVFPQCCGGTVDGPSETPWNTFQGYERTRRERERTFRHAVTTSRVPTMNQSDRTMPSAVCGRTAPIGMDAPCSLPGLGEKCVRICESQPSWTKLLIDGWRVEMNGCEASNLSDGSALVV